MERFMCFLIGFIFLSCSVTQVYSAGDVAVTVEPTSITVWPGNPVNDQEILCEVHVTMGDLVNMYRLFWISPEGKTLNRMADNAPGVSSEKYDFRMKIGKDGATTILAMTIKDFSGADAGAYTCELTSKSSSDPSRSFARFTAKAKYDVANLKLKINELEFEQYMEDPIQLTENTYKVSCLSKGSNPPAQIQLFIQSADGSKRDVPSPLTVPSIRKKDGRVETFEVDFVQNVAFSEDDARITCKAEVPNTEFGEKRVSVGLQILPVNPIFDCENTTAEVGEENVLLTCKIISYHPMKEYEWFEGNEEEPISANYSSFANFVAIERERDRDDEGKYFITTSVEIRLARRYVFDTIFYLEVLAGHGETYRHGIKLKEGYTSSTTRTYSSLSVLFAAILLSCVSF